MGCGYGVWRVWGGVCGRRQEEGDSISMHAFLHRTPSFPSAFAGIVVYQRGMQGPLAFSHRPVRRRAWQCFPPPNQMTEASDIVPAPHPEELLGQRHPRLQPSPHVPAHGVRG